MANDRPLMPKATAVWLVENTALTFSQIAEFCGLHMLEVQGIANEEVAQGIKGMDPITSNQLTRDEIERGQADSNYKLHLLRSKVVIPSSKKKVRKRPKYVPVSKRQDRPNAIVWLVRNHPELVDSQIIRLVGTTKPTIEKIRTRSHKSMASFQPADPVALGLCSQSELDMEVSKAATRIRREGGQMPQPVSTLLPTESTIPSADSSNINPFDTPQPSILGDTQQQPSGLTSAEEAKREADNLFSDFPDQPETSEQPDIPDMPNVFQSAEAVEQPDAPGLSEQPMIQEPPQKDDGDNAPEGEAQPEETTQPEEAAQPESAEAEAREDVQSDAESAPEEAGAEPQEEAPKNDKE